jgi:co-chaperonin GroES (HSP10)
MKVKGYRILVKPDDIKTTSDGGIVLVLDERMEQASQQFGTVIDIGPTCWTMQDDLCTIRTITTKST